MTDPAKPAARTVSFRCDGFTLVGTLHQPAANAPTTDFAVVMLNQGPLDRSGAHRISTQLARRWATQGVPVLRFDARGVGESEGDWAEPPDGTSIKVLYKLIEEGGWVTDAHAAIDYALTATGARRIVLAGLCGGGATAVHAATHRAVHAVLTVGMPVRVQAEITGVSDLVDVKLRTETRGYLKKLLAPAAWKRLLTLQTDYHTLWGVFSTRAKRLLGRGGGLDPRLNATLVRSFEAAVRQHKRILFVYPEKDYLWVEFQELFQSRFPRAKFGFEVATIPQANHTFTEPSWQDALHGIVDAWTVAQTEGQALT